MIAQYNTQLKYRRVVENGDMVFGTGSSDFKEGADAMEQVLKTRLGACENEWWEGDPGAIPWFSEVLGRMVTQEQIDEIDLLIIDRIMDTVGVNSVSGIESGVEDRHYHFTCTAHTVHGDVPVEVNI